MPGAIPTVTVGICRAPRRPLPERLCRSSKRRALERSAWPRLRIFGWSSIRNASTRCARIRCSTPSSKPASYSCRSSRSRCWTTRITARAPRAHWRLLSKSPDQLVAAWQALAASMIRPIAGGGERVCRPIRAIAQAIGLQGTPTLIWKKPDGTEGPDRRCADQHRHAHRLNRALTMQNSASKTPVNPAEEQPPPRRHRSFFGKIFHGTGWLMAAPFAWSGADRIKTQLVV